MSDSVEPKPKRTRCYICNVKVHPEGNPKKKSKEHVQMDLIPKGWEARLIKSRLWTKEDCEHAWIDACFTCSEAVSRYFNSLERARWLTCPQTLKAALKEIGWLEIRLERNENGKTRMKPSKLDKLDWNPPACIAYKQRWLTTEVFSEPEVDADCDHEEEEQEEGGMQEDDNTTATAARGSKLDDEDDDEEALTDMEQSEKDSHVDDSEEDSGKDLSESSESEDNDHKGPSGNNSEEASDPKVPEIPALSTSKDTATTQYTAQEKGKAVQRDSPQEERSNESITGSTSPVQSSSHQPAPSNTLPPPPVSTSTSDTLTKKDLCDIFLRLGENHETREQHLDGRMTKLMDTKLAVVDERFKLAEERHLQLTKSLEKVEKSSEAVGTVEKKKTIKRIQECEEGLAALRAEFDEVKEKLAEDIETVRNKAEETQEALEGLKTDIAHDKVDKATLKRALTRIEALEAENERRPMKRRKLGSERKEALFASESSGSDSSDAELPRARSESIPIPTPRPQAKRKTPFRHESIDEDEDSAAAQPSPSRSQEANEAAAPPLAIGRPTGKRTGALVGSMKLLAVEIPVPPRAAAGTPNGHPHRASQQSQYATAASAGAEMSLDEEDIDELRSPVANLVSDSAKNMMIESYVNDVRAGRRSSDLATDASGENDNGQDSSTRQSSVAHMDKNASSSAFAATRNVTPPAKTAASSTVAKPFGLTNGSTSGNITYTDDNIPIIDVTRGPDDFLNARKAACLPEKRQATTATRPRQYLASTSLSASLGTSRAANVSGPAQPERHTAQTSSFFDEWLSNNLPDTSTTLENHRKLRNGHVYPLVQPKVASAPSQTSPLKSSNDTTAVKAKTEVGTENDVLPAAVNGLESEVITAVSSPRHRTRGQKVSARD